MNRKNIAMVITANRTLTRSGWKRGVPDGRNTFAAGEGRRTCVAGGDGRRTWVLVAKGHIHLSPQSGVISFRTPTSTSFTTGFHQGPTTPQGERLA